ncbi:MAG: cyclic pyranopterin monophosphate synthase MoaC [Deltaproteobacteria bacterium]|nr:cyclic pyranopterin monophosphate synthase MoaC [Deltaproteobacteria bacterium]MBN2686578.1 cyclic pyranopterin monophosphate synthase MoaC [Deltaproteobacteria bacterium]
MADFTHLDEKNKSRMVDVTSKEPTLREAVARGTVVMNPATVQAIEAGGMAKGDVLGVARIAAVMGAKRTSDLIPLCHPLELTGIDVQFSIHADTGEITIDATVKTFSRTGVEMEALTAVCTAALTIYDMCKSADKRVTITDVRLIKKSGGRSGTFIRE